MNAITSSRINELQAAGYELMAHHPDAPAIDPWDENPVNLYEAYRRSVDGKHSPWYGSPSGMDVWEFIDEIHTPIEKKATS